MVVKKGDNASTGRPLVLPSCIVKPPKGIAWCLSIQYRNYSQMERAICATNDHWAIQHTSTFKREKSLDPRDFYIKNASRMSLQRKLGWCITPMHWSFWEGTLPRDCTCGGQKHSHGRQPNSQTNSLGRGLMAYCLSRDPRVCKAMQGLPDEGTIAACHLIPNFYSTKVE